MATAFVDKEMTSRSEVASKPAVHMKHQGHYDGNCLPQRSDIKQTEELLIELAYKAPVACNKQPITIADFGCGQGRSSFEAMTPLVKKLKYLYPEKALVIYHNDLEQNDFNSLAKQSWQHPLHHNVFSYMASGSYFNQILPSNSLHLGTCFAALHWLDGLPSLRTIEHVTHEAAPERYAGIYGKFWIDQWRRFLESRVEELVEGGHLLISFVGRKDFREPTHAPFELIFQSLRELVRMGLLSCSQLEAVQLPVHRPCSDEVLAPFDLEQKDSLQQMKITHYNITQQKCPFWKQWKQKESDLELYAFRLSEFIRAFSEPVIRHQLSHSMEGKEKGEGDMDQICDVLYKKIRCFIANAPERYAMSRTRIELILEKSGG